MTRPEPRVAYLDHAVVPGGAQLALKRILALEMTERILLIPGRSVPGWGIFSEIVSADRHLVMRVGPEQGAGATTQKGAFKFARFAIQILQQALILRATRQFRDAQIIHANSARAALYGAVACFATKKAFVVHLRDMTDRASLGRIGFAGFKFLALRRADAVIANSQATLDSAEAYLSPRVIKRVIPSPIGISAPVSLPTITGRVQTIGMVARIDSWKGQDVAIEAFAQAFKGTHIKLLFAGEALFGKESIKNDLVELARSLGIESQVQFLGHITDVQSFIASLDICLQSSTRPEPLGQNVLQYLRLGRPTIAVNEGGPSEWIRDGINGLLVPMGDVDALATSLSRLASDADLREHLSRGALGTPHILSDGEVCEAHNQLYELLANRN